MMITSDFRLQDSGNMESLQGLGFTHPLVLKTVSFKGLQFVWPCVVRLSSYCFQYWSISGFRAYNQVFFSKGSEELGYFPISCTE